MQSLLSSISAWHLKQAYHATEKEVAGHIKVEQRLERAYKMLTVDQHYEIGMLETDQDFVFKVVGPNDTYIVDPDKRSCTCPDNEQLCKHRLAVRLILKALYFKEE